MMKFWSNNRIMNEQKGCSYSQSKSYFVLPLASTKSEQSVLSV